MELELIIAIFILWTCGFPVLGGALGEEAASGESRLVALELCSLASMTLVGGIVTQGFCQY